MKNDLIKSILAGMCIGIGATGFIACDNKYVGAAVFCLGLFTICVYGFNLFTGKIGYAIEQRKNLGVGFYLTVWLGNLAGCAIVCVPMRLARADYAAKAASIVESKLGQSIPQAIVFGILCGILMYIAVNTFREDNHPIFKVVAIYACVIMFILCGFEHSIADMCYFFYGVPIEAAKLAQSSLYIVIISLSNGIGSIIFATLVGLGRKKKN